MMTSVLATNSTKSASAATSASAAALSSKNPPAATGPPTALASAASAQAKCSRIGRDTSLARIAASGVTFIAGMTPC
jgi:hypothetical protein